MNALKTILAVAAIVLPGAGFAQGYPERPITVVVPFPPGGNVDSAARIIAPKMEELLGQPIVVENRAGAGGMIASEYVKKASPDGYTLLMSANGPMLFAPITMNRPDAYDWKTDFELIGAVSITPMALTVRSDLGITDMNQLFAEAGEKNLLMASPGAGTTNHLIGEKLIADGKADFRIVHYNGNAPAVASLLGGETAFSFDQLSVILPYIQDESVTPLAVTSEERIDALPDIPTLRESGEFDYAAVTFTGLMAPAGTPEEAITKVSDALMETLRTEEVQKRFADLGAIASPQTPKEFHDFVKDIDDTWRPLVEEVNADK